MPRKHLIHFVLIVTASVALVVRVIWVDQNFGYTKFDPSAANERWVIFMNIYVLAQQLTALGIYAAIVTCTLAHAWLTGRTANSDPHPDVTNP